MRLRLVIFSLLALLIAAPIAAQEAFVDITIFRDVDSLTVYVPEGGSLDGITFQVTTTQGEITRPLAEFAAFFGLPLTGEACFRLERAGSTTPIAQDCQSIQIFEQTLADADVFWYDTALNQPRPVLILSAENMAGFCPGNTPSCAIQFIPTVGEDSIALCPGAAVLDDHEILVLIATFRQISGNPLEPHFEWERTLQEAIAQLEGRVNARVLVLPQIITSQEEALRLSDCYNATLVIWGAVTAAEVESTYTTTARWSQIYVQPSQTDFTINESSTQSIIDQLTIFISKNGGDSEYNLNFVLAQLVYYDENRGDALPFLERAIALAPVGREREMGAAAMYFYLGYIQGAIQGNADAALLSFSTALEIGPFGISTAKVYNNRGVAYFSQDNYDQAISDFSQAIALQPDYVDPYINRGNVYYKQRKYTLARADLTQAIILNPNFAEAYSNRGIIYLRQGNIALAISDLTRSIELNHPELHVPYYNRGIAYYDQGDLDRAIADYSQAITLKPDFADAYFNRGSAYQDQGDLDRAIADYSQAITLKPDFADAYNNRGFVYSDQGDLDRAIADYSQAITLKPDFADAHYNRGIAYSDQGDFDRAIADFSEAITLKSDYAEAYYNRGTVYYNRGNYAHAITDYSQAIALKSNYANAYYNRGIAYSDQGDFDRAIIDFREVIAINPDDVNAYGILGLTYDQTSQHDDALANYRRYIELAGDSAAPFVVTRVRELEAATPTPIP